MKEKILDIKELDIKEIDNDYCGYVIKTDKQEIKILIDNSAHCCESWGYFSSEDDFTSFIGCDYLGISVVDTAYNKRSLDQCPSLDEGGVCFVNIETSLGTLQFAVYNAHNGYYSHNINVISNELKHEDYL